MIRVLVESDIIGLNKLPPLEWKYDYESFLMSFISDDFFHAFVILQDGLIVGTGNVFLKEKVGWLANIIIDENQRGKGLGYKMTKFLVDFLYDQGCETQLLIATELGERVYKKIGFRKMSEYLYFESEVDQECIYSESIRNLEKSDLDSVYELDKLVNRENRKHLIDKYFESGIGYFNTDKELLGFYFPNFGRGLILAKDRKAGIELLKIKHSKQGKVTLLPIENKDGINFLENSNLKKGVSCSRMILGKENKWNPENIYSIGGGFCG